MKADRRNGLFLIELSEKEATRVAAALISGTTLDDDRILLQLGIPASKIGSEMVPAQLSSALLRLLKIEVPESLVENEESVSYGGTE